jgi:hypothetical protein
MSDTSVPMILNMSWSIAKSSYLESKITDLLSAGIVIVCSAGNTGISVDLLTPANMTDVITVAASDADDVSAGFNNFSEADYAINSNYGLKVDIFAPGVDCVGAHYSGTSTYCSYSGTSISAGYVSGCMAAILALVPGTYRESAMKALMDSSTKGVLLLDIDRYQFNQNNLAYLITGEMAPGIDEVDAYYLGHFSTSTTTIIGNANQVMNVSRYTTDTGEEFNYEVVWTTPAMEEQAASCITIINDGSFTITNPSLTWLDGERIRFLEFKVKAQSLSASIKFYSANLIFFAYNPAIEGSVDEDVLTSLDAITTQNFFSPWACQLKILP